MSPEEVRVSSGLLQGQGLWVQQTWVWHKPSWRRSPLTPPQSHQNLHRSGKQTLGGRKQNLVHTRTQEKGAMTPQETGPDLPVSCECPGVSSGGMGWWWPAAGSGALSSAVRAGDLLKEVAIIFITPTIVGLRSNNRKVTQPHPSTENWIKDLLSMAPPIRIRPSFPHSQSLLSGSFPKPLILIHQRANRMKPQSQKTNQSDHMDHSLV